MLAGRSDEDAAGFTFRTVRGERITRSQCATTAKPTAILAPGDTHRH